MMLIIFNNFFFFFLSILDLGLRKQPHLITKTEDKLKNATIKNVNSYKSMSFDDDRGHVIGL